MLPTRATLWWPSTEVSRRPALPGDRDADVAIVGAGFTGLWTAYYLKRADPGLRIVVLEREFAGFGASGRNGGWCSALFPASWDRIGRDRGRSAALSMKAAMQASIDEVERVIRREGIACGFARGGTLGFARSPVQRRRAAAAVAHARSWDDPDTRWLEPGELSEITGVTGALGATFSPHCAALDPGALVRGLADRVVSADVEVFEDTAVQRIWPGAGRPSSRVERPRVVTDHGTVRAEVVIRATEAYTHDLPGHRRDLAPVYSLIVATEPLEAGTLAAIGLADRPTFTDHRHMICYGQRTADGRIVFGGRGAPYHFGSDTGTENDRDSGVFRALRHAVVDMFPALNDVRFSHAWGGPLGIPRDWHAGVGLNPTTGLGWAGGYVGDGVSTSNLAGRTLADLITGRNSELTRLPWVGHWSRRWEPEPFRYLGVNAGLQVMAAADRRETRTGRESTLARGFGRLLGG